MSAAPHVVCSETELTRHPCWKEVSEVREQVALENPTYCTCWHFRDIETLGTGRCEPECNRDSKQEQHF